MECTVKNVPNIDRTFIAKGSSRRKAEQAAAEQIFKNIGNKMTELNQEQETYCGFIAIVGRPKCGEIHPVKQNFGAKKSRLLPARHKPRVTVLWELKPRHLPRNLCGYAGTSYRRKTSD